MNIKIPFKNIFVKKHKTGLRVPLATIAAIEVVAGILLFGAAIGFDVWVYRVMVARSADISQEDIHGVTALDEKGLEKASSRIKEDEAFIENPTFPLLHNLF